MVIIQKMQNKRLFILALVALLAAAVGCGSSGSEGTSETSVTKKQYVLRAEKVCLNTESEQFQTISTYSQEHPEVDEEKAVVEAGLPPLEAELAKLEALEQPRTGNAQLEAFFAAFDRAITESQEDPSRVLTQEGNPFATPNKLAEAYGLKGCSGNP